MPFPTATQSPSETASGESAINDLLGADLAATETDTQDVGEQSPVDDPDVDVQEEVEPEVVEGEETEPEADEEQGEEEADEQDESGEEELNLDELETDFADSAYARAAQHYSKQFGKELDPKDPSDRAILKELMDRGQKISELQSKEPEEELEEEAPAPAKDAAPARTPEQMLQDRISGVRSYAKETFNPVVAKEVVLPMAQAIAEFMFPGKGAEALAGRTEAQLMSLTQALTAAMAMQIADAVPQIVGASAERSKSLVNEQYPYMTKMHEMAEKEAAVDEILQSSDEYPGFARLVDSGAINKALASPDLKNAVFNKDPFKNRIAKLKVAYKLARNERVDPQALAKAAKRGRTAEKERATRVAAGRTSPGNSTRETAPGKSSFLQSLVGGGESRSANLFKNVGRRQE